MAGEGERSINMSIKRIITKACPSFLMKPALDIVHRFRAVRGRVEMRLFSQNMMWFCPCCGMKVKEFIAADYLDPRDFNPARYEKTEQKVLCPTCKALPRHRILASWCENHKELFHNTADILYFAPEYSMTRWMKRNHVSYTTADLYKDADLKLDIQNTKLPDESHDVIICNHVLEHVDDFRLALREVFRILRTGGSFICSFPMDPKIELVDEDPSVKKPEERFLRFGQDDHKRVFGMKAEQLLSDAGFTVEIINGTEYPDEIMPVVGPADYDMNILFRCMK